MVSQRGYTKAYQRRLSRASTLLLTPIPRSDTPTPEIANTALAFLEPMARDWNSWRGDPHREERRMKAYEAVPRNRSLEA